MWPKAKYVYSLTTPSSATEFLSIFNVLRVIVFGYVGSKFASEINEHSKDIKFRSFPKPLLKFLLFQLLFILQTILKSFFLLKVYFYNT